MSEFSRIDVIRTMTDTGLVPLFYHPDSEVMQNVVQACYRGGARVFEFTSRGAFAHEIFAELKKFTARECPEMMLGVGSVTDAAAASLYMNLGASFVITPVFREDIAVVCNRRKVLWSPGCGTLTEIAKAEEFGCEIVKLFPGSVYGPSFVKAIKGPCPWTSIMPTGGVTPDPDNLKGWFNAGVTCVGMGSQLITSEIIENGDYDVLEQQVHQVLKTIAGLR
ncbi:bifunctional 4-hydroxy-2-oxoglutarate aldolase/2-dehydro-3-deoxy-phosphogluconate aldolase [Robertkochia solimangrovi]|uniref:bifunctional 4-hydroxy-2-oxoglutarate aldolase/2-dehydro-3-deoxy-phosphogluconate aldolase n=1 Tax=Robertkochia solimangrovi TaxID=2213046 RepID=UPI00117C93FD|nr:bifunctional 4-hydroxy-2-oxoglutarate aldolase/2-dehydro-3-deoxy-phosphogluconate aldolase [Robertkochia solimangrovi]TRZ46202.1 bifunctional 4-hydroxy-2-oxoglutarate aldolase/2-dehydro-3-deoxy-phosphogluconate aldolase [Robertkochia solimangrovi]